MLVTIDCHRHILALLPLVVLISWGGSNPATPSRTDVQVSGIWDARFSGTVQGTGTAQSDNFVMKLQQDGSSVTGTLQFQGLDLSFPLSGKVVGTAFSYSSKASLGPTCEATVVGETTVDAAAGRLAGSQTQANCEGTAVGQVTAVRR